MDSRQLRPLYVCLFALSTLAACGGSGGGGGNGGTPVSAPSNLDYSDADALELSGVEIAPLLPTFDGDVDTFEIAPALPAGLVLDPSTGVLAGSAVAPSARRTYTVTARNAAGSTTRALRIEVVAPQRFAFATSATDDSLASFSVDSAADALLRGPLAISAASDVGAERGVAHPSAPFAYVPYANTNTLVVYRVDPANGALERVASRPLGAGPHAAAFDPTGAWLLVTSQLADEVRVYSVGAVDGLPTLMHQVTVGTQPSDLGFAPDGRQLYVSHAGVVMNGLGSSLASYAFEPANGTLALQGTPLALNGSRPLALAVDPHERLVYITLSMFDAVLAVRTNAAGALIPVPPLRPAGDDPADLSVDPRGRFLYVADASSDSIRTFAVQSNTGDLTVVGDYAAGDEPRTLQVDPTGERVRAVARASAELITYVVQPDGALAQESSVALRPGTSALTYATGVAPLAWSTRFVHVANSGSDDVHSFRADDATGALTFTGQAFTDDAPAGIAIDPRTRFAVVVAQGARTVQSFTISSSNGALTPVGASIPVAGTPTHATIDRSGRFAYVVARDVVVPNDGRIMTYSIDAATGALTLVDTRAAGLAPCAVAIEPTGEYVYVANRGDGTPGSATIAAFHTSPVTGIPTAVGSPVVAPGIAALAFHPDGLTAYAVLRGADALARYAIDRSNGNLTAVPPAAGTGFEPAALAVDPRGRFAWASYTGNAGAGQIDVLPMLANGGLGAALQQLVDGNDPIALSLDASGRFLYAANMSSHDVSVLAVDGATGLLEARTPMLAGTAPVAIVASGSTH